VTPFWHPVSALFAVDPPMPATTRLVRMLLAAGPAQVRYVGDRMAPSVPSGSVVRLAPAAGSATKEGEAVAARVGGALDLARVCARRGTLLLLRGDAEPGGGAWVEQNEVVGRAILPPSLPSAPARAWRRARLDLAEAWRGRCDAGPGDPAHTVLDKYEAQAPFYAAEEGAVDPSLLRRAGEAFPRGGRILVAGSGAGGEAFALAAAGWPVRGVDFSPAMVSAARRRALELGLDVSFVEADLRHHQETEGSLAGVLFTYDVYSFLPRPADRLLLLRRAAGWLGPGGSVLLSARRVRGLWPRIVLTVQWLSHRGRSPWGASHTRWISPAGEMHRSFVQLFPARQLRREWSLAGFRSEGWRGGHVRLVPSGSPAGSRSATAVRTA
jgi:SAM-dependent methyltransferase